MFSRLRHKRHYLIGIGAIGMNIARLPSPVAQSFSQCLATFILYIAYHDTGTFANECFSGGSAHSTCAPGDKNCFAIKPRSEEHTSELQSLMRISYAVFCLKKQNITHNIKQHINRHTT